MFAGVCAKSGATVGSTSATAGNPIARIAVKLFKTGLDFDSQDPGTSAKHLSG